MTMGRPRIEFNEDTWKQIQEMCKIHCTKQEISDVLGVSEDTIEKRIAEKFECTFTVFYKRYSAEGKKSLRRMQWDSAENGNVTMQIWLGKQELGQSDRQEIQHKGPQEVTIVNDLDAS